MPTVRGLGLYGAGGVVEDGEEVSGIGSHSLPNQGATNEWLTPPEILQVLGPFDLDPCAMVDQPWQTARIQWTIKDNGCMRPWSGRVWLNPPYGPSTGGWLRLLSEHGDGIAIVFARTETAMFFEWVWPKADALLFLKGRPHFCRQDGSRAEGNSGGPVVLIAYGARNAEQLSRCGIPGAFVRLK
jgi:hypothetical protein